MIEQILNKIHLPRRVKSYQNGEKYYHSIISGDLKKKVKLDNNKVIQEIFSTKNKEETFDYIIINGKRILSSYTKDKKIHIQRDTDTTPWITSTLKKVFGTDGKLQSVTTMEFSAPYYHMRPCAKGRIDTYEGRKIVSSKDISGQY